MKLQTKFSLGVIVIFSLLAVIIAIVTFNYVNTNTIREAENRVRIYMRAAWEIHDSEIEPVRSAAEVLSQRGTIRELLSEPQNEQLRLRIQEELEPVRQSHGADILNLMTPDGTVIVRTRFPYNTGDTVTDDPMVRKVINAQQSSAGNVIFPMARLDVEGPGLIERTLSYNGDPRGMLAGAAVPVVENGQLLGIIQMGRLLNGYIEEVDRIRDAVFANEYYQGKPVGTATIFMDDLRISTNVQDNQGRRAVGTRVSREVAEHVLEKGLSWTGRAFVVDTWYLSQYDPIKDPDGTIIGMLYVGELEQKYLDLRTRAVLLTLSVILAGMILTFIMSYFIIRGILEPTRNLLHATRSISSGDLSHRVEVTGKDEVSQLAISFNEMAEQLEQQRQKIEQNQTELEDLNSELRGINKNYMEMLGFVSHELKNPLTSAIMSLYTVKDGYLGEINPAQQKSLNSVANSLDYFQEMIQHYLDLSRLEKGELEVNITQVCLNDDIVQPVINSLEREMHERHMTLENHIPEGLILNVDYNLLRIVYDNLLSNAIKYGLDGGRIILDAQESRQMMVLSVLNDSQGIPPEKLSHLFKKFGRLDDPQFASKKGTGLGLFICRQIIEKHGGEIWAASEVGAWVKFSFTLPK